MVTGVLLAALVASACGSGTSSKAQNAPPTTGPNAPIDKTLGNGVTANTIKLGVALVDFKDIKPFTPYRTNAEQREIYDAYINNINAKGGIQGRKIVPVYRFYNPVGPGGSQILTLCTVFAEDENVFAVTGTFVDFSGDAQTCIAKQHKRVLLTFNLAQENIDDSPPGLIVTPGNIPDRSAKILIELLKKEKTLEGKQIGVLGDTTESAVVNKTIVPQLKRAGVDVGTVALLSIGGTNPDTTTPQAQLDSFIEKWKQDKIAALFLSGDLASTKQFVQKVKTALPNLVLAADNTDVLGQARDLQKAKVKKNPYEGIISAGGLTPKEYDASDNWKYCADIYHKETGKVAENAEQTKKDKDGYINDTYGAINDACQLLSMFHDIGERVGRYLNDANWVYAVDHFGKITNRGTGPYSTLHAGKYSADDNWRLQKYDSTVGESGNWVPITPLQNISG